MNIYTKIKRAILITTICVLTVLIIFSIHNLINYLFLPIGSPEVYGK